MIADFPIPPITPSNEAIITEIESTIEEILHEKSKIKADTHELEHKIDNLIYRLYNLTGDEIKIIE